jgi:uncharacterized membrane protein
VNPWLLAGTTFLASAVEFVEAATIVLAVGVTSGWRPALAGTICAALVLAALTAFGTPVLTSSIALDRLELIVGLFLVLFGIAWLRKAIWRYAGRKPMRDESAAFAREVTRLRAETSGAHGFATAFQGVFVEGLEVAVIVVTFAASTPSLVAWSAGGAVVALLVVSIVAAALRAPFSQVPENTLKAVVGVMLLSLGTYWTGEGLGLRWWLGDATLLALICAFAAIASAVVLVQRATRT